ncbi:MAG: hypothetical protein LW850_01330, partial [Planctomycetaceae bacterium]|nr:hypothetical protein [Planctomycetaceae bacterium]
MEIIQRARPQAPRLQVSTENTIREFNKKISSGVACKPSNPSENSTSDMAKVRIFPSLNRKPVTDWKEFNDSAEVSCAFQATMEFGRPAGFQLDEEPAPAGCPGFGAGV